MMNRRHFLGSAAVFTIGSFVPSRNVWAKRMCHLQRIGVQLFTVRNLLKADFEGTLAQIAQIGFKEVEFAGYYDRPADKIRELLKRNRLESPACHVQYDAIADDKKLAEQIKASKAIGHKYITHPWIPVDLRKTLEDWKKVAKLFNHVGSVVAKEGLQFAYHNHWFEFQALEGKLPFDVLLAECDPKLVAMELDLGWISTTGTDPVPYFEKHKGRFPLVHIKDVTHLPNPKEKDPSAFQSPVGKGILDWKRLLARAVESGTKHFFVEQDAAKEPLTDIETSYKFLQQLSC